MEPIESMGSVCRRAAGVPLVLTRVLIGAATALTLACPAAGVYRCTNAAGEVDYSDTECAEDVAAKQELDIRARNPNTGAADTSDNPYSLVNQAYTIKRREAAARRRAAATGIGLSPDDPTGLARVDAALAALDRDERALQAELGGASLRARWAQEDVTEIKRQRAELLPVQERLQARVRQAAAASAAAAEARAAAAEAQTQDPYACARRAGIPVRNRDAPAWARTHEAVVPAVRKDNTYSTGSLQALPKKGK